MYKIKQIYMYMFFLICSFMLVFIVLFCCFFNNADINVIIIKTGSESSEYSSQKVFCDEYEVIGLSNGYTAEVVMTGFQIDVGKSPNYADVKILDKKGKNVTDLFNIQFEYGELSITPRKIKIKSSSLTKKYDGEDFHNKTYDIEYGSICDGEELVAYFPYSHNEIGEYANIIDIEIYKKEDGISISTLDNYILEYEYGTLKITP